MKALGHFTAPVESLTGIRAIVRAAIHDEGGNSCFSPKCGNFASRTNPLIMSARVYYLRYDETKVTYKNYLLTYNDKEIRKWDLIEENKAKGGMTI